jgi:hypothetical protein
MIREGNEVLMAGIFDPYFIFRIDKEQLEKSMGIAQAAMTAGLAKFGLVDTLNFVDCLVLSSHPHAARARALLAAAANARQELEAGQPVR